MNSPHIIYSITPRIALLEWQSVAGALIMCFSLPPLVFFNHFFFFFIKILICEKLFCSGSDAVVHQRFLLVTATLSENFYKE